MSNLVSDAKVSLSIDENKNDTLLAWYYMHKFGEKLGEKVLSDSMYSSIIKRIQKNIGGEVDLDKLPIPSGVKYHYTKWIENFQ